MQVECLWTWLDHSGISLYAMTVGALYTQPLSPAYSQMAIQRTVCTFFRYSIDWDRVRVYGSVLGLGY